MIRFSAAPRAMQEDGVATRVLVVDDDAAVRQALTRILGSRGVTVATVEDGLSALAYIEGNEVDVALVDLHMPGMNGLQTLSRLKEIRPDLAVILMTGLADVEVAVAAIKEGAFYFFNKPFSSNEAVAAIIEKASAHRRLQVRTRELQERLEAQEPFADLIGTSTAMQSVYRMIESVAPATSTVLILGESGTGKELVARAIHQASPRASRSIVVVNCGAIPKELVEAELFGHARGAFTGAHTARPGLFESADGGTIFLDEIADLPPPAQVKLLRTLQNGEIRRVGSNETRTVDVRVVAATNVDLAASIAAGTFRRDLYYRLNVISLTLPPLRERGDDVLLLASHFLAKLARRMGKPEKRLSSRAMRTIVDYSWPGNVRELEHAMERAFVLSRQELIEPSDLPFAATSKVSVPTLPPRASGRTERPEPPRDRLPLFSSLMTLPYATAKRRAAELFDKAYVEELLRSTNGNRSLAARRAGLDRANLRRVMRRTRRD